MMELTNGIGLEPRYFVTEVSVEHIEAGLRQRPCVADIHLRKIEQIVRTCKLSIVNYAISEL